MWSLKNRPVCTSHTKCESEKMNGAGQLLFISNLFIKTHEFFFILNSSTVDHVREKSPDETQHKHRCWEKNCNCTSAQMKAHYTSFLLESNLECKYKSRIYLNKECQPLLGIRDRVNKYTMKITHHALHGYLHFRDKFIFPISESTRLHFKFNAHKYNILRFYLRKFGVHEWCELLEEGRS